jgi:hypothetical protein
MERQPFGSHAALEGEARRQVFHCYCADGVAKFARDSKQTRKNIWAGLLRLENIVR